MTMKIHRLSAAAQIPTQSETLPLIASCSFEAMYEDTNFTFLPEEIVAEIILRLPVKPLFRFKCVSKRCKSIISGRKFALKYLQRVYSSPESSSSSGLAASLLFPFTHYQKYLSKNVNDWTRTINSNIQLNHDDQLSISVSSVDVSAPNKEDHTILASSNGLILSLFHPKLRLMSAFLLHVSNPLTKKCVQLPKSMPVDPDEFLFGIATRLLRDDDQAAPAAATFLTYKVVAIRYVYTDIGPQDYANTSVNIFSSVTGSWVALELRCCPGEVFGSSIPSGGLTYKGALHWLSRKTRTVITYDPYNSPHRFGHIRLPSQNYSSRHGSLIYSGDEEMLKYCEIYKGEGVDRVSVWRLVFTSSGNGEWSIEGSFLVPPLGHRCWKVMVAPYPWNRHIICHPYVRHNKLAVINPWTGRREFVNLFDGTTRPALDLFSLYNGKFGYSFPLVLIQLCPWSSPLYAQAS